MHLGHTKHTFTEMYESLTEGSTENAAGTLNAIIGFLSKKDKSDSGNDMQKMALGIKSDFKKRGSFSPDQAKWIFNTSKALFKK